MHRAKLKGEEVVVKVQRPGLKDLFDIDLKNLRVCFLNFYCYTPDLMNTASSPQIDCYSLT